MQRRLAGGTVMAAARGFAVDGDEFGGIAAQLARPGHEAVGEQVGVDAVQKDIEPAGARHPVVIGQKAPQEGEMGPAPGGDIVEVVAGGDAGADDEKQDLRQRMRHPPLFAPVFDDRKMIQQTAQAGLVVEVFHGRPPKSSWSPSQSFRLSI